MATGSTPGPGRLASDGTPYPDRDAPGFERSVRAMFTHIATGYDAFDHLASLGQDFLWRPRALWDLDRFRGGRPIGRILDVGCGPGSLSFLAATHYPRATLVGADFTMAMVERAHTRARESAMGAQLNFERASVLDLPFRNGSFDVAMSAFVVRNLPDLPRAFGELRRVLTPGGTLLTLEITEPANALVRWGFHRYFDTMVPFLGELLGSEGPYRYLPESLRRMPDRAGMTDLLRSAGFDRVEARPQSFGIVTNYIAGVATP